MKTKNCPNCGAPYDAKEHKCPYCETQYFDMSFVDFENNEPFYMKIKTNIDGHEFYLTQLVKPFLKSVEQNQDMMEVHGGIGNCTQHRYMVSNQLTTNVGFIAIPDKQGNLMYIEKI